MTTSKFSQVDWRVFEDEGGFAELTIPWLATRDAALWHRSANGINWDWGWRILGWIVSQPRCSKSTAAMIFWGAQPQELIDPAMNREWLNDMGSPYYLIKLIVENLQQGLFSDDRFPVFWNADLEKRVVDFKAILARHADLQDPWSLALTLIPKFPVSHCPRDPEFIEGIPVHFWET
jgi:Domain of unknown function (DUF4274)